MTPLKKAARNLRNKAEKIRKAFARRANLALVGKLVYDKVVAIDIETSDGVQTKTVPDFALVVRTARDGSILPLKQTSNDIPARVAGYGSTSLLFLSARQHKQHGAQAKTRPGNHLLHGEATVENHSRSLAVEIDKALAPADSTPIPVIPVNVAEEAAQL